MTDGIPEQIAAIIATIGMSWIDITSDQSESTNKIRHDVAKNASHTTINANIFFLLSQTSDPIRPKVTDVNR